MYVDRSYLPYKSAREYQDRGIKKWMGFFLSEHTSALKEFHDYKPNVDGQNMKEIYLRINQAYSQQIRVKYTFYDSKGKIKSIEGVLNQIGEDSIGIKDGPEFTWVPINKLLRLDLSEEEFYE
ncbi:hypothetical protein ACWOA0_07905 [Ignavigranum ruoffiae]